MTVFSLQRVGSHPGILFFNGPTAPKYTIGEAGLRRRQSEVRGDATRRVAPGDAGRPGLRRLWMVLAAAVGALVAAVLFVEVQNQRNIGASRLLHSIKEVQEVAPEGGGWPEAPGPAGPTGEAIGLPEAGPPTGPTDGKGDKAAGRSTVSGAPDTDQPRALAAIVIDDLGWDTQVAREFADLGVPLTFAVLPHVPHSREVVELAHRAGLEVLLHLPMEPVTYPQTQPGQGALFTYMEQAQILDLVRTALDAVPYATGVNNHMGSRFTQDEERMEIVLRELLARGLYFVDSVTSPDSVGLQVARSIDLPALRRQVFLDDTDDPAAIRAEVDRLIAIALKNGQAIAIGHPRANTYRVLRESLPALAARGIELVPAHRLLERPQQMASSTAETRPQPAADDASLQR